MLRFKQLIQLYIAFFRVGLFTIGGGYAMLPIIEQELVKDQRIMSMDEVVECYTLAQTLPGVIAANTSALIGYRLGKTKGALFCTLGVITPSIIIIMLIAMIFTKIEDQQIVKNAFKGIRVVVLALLLDSFQRLFKAAIFDKKTAGIALFAFVLVLFSLINPVLVIVAGGISGVLVFRERVGK